MIQGAVFDLWNTLVNPTKSNHAMKYIQDKWNIEPRLYRTEIKKELMKRPLENAEQIAYFLNKQFGMKYPKEETLHGLDAVIASDKAEVELFSDTLGTLEYMKEQGMRTALISNAVSFHKDPFYKFRLGKYFDYACFSCDVGMWKPEPEIYLTALHMLRLKPEEAIMVGDSMLKDAVTPSLLGMKGIHLDRRGLSNYKNRVSSLYDLKKHI